jgi:hypothetical protein
MNRLFPRIANIILAHRYCNPPATATARWRPCNSGMGCMNKDSLCLFSHHLFLGRAHVGRRQLEPHECILLRHVPFSVVLTLPTPLSPTYICTYSRRTTLTCLLDGSCTTTHLGYYYTQLHFILSCLDLTGRYFRDITSTSPGHQTTAT